MKNIIWSVVLLIPILIGAGGENKKPADPHLYVSWNTMEADKSASAWLIKRFIDKEARFKFVPEGEIITEGIPFDTPDSEFRRSQNFSTFESILNKFKIKDAALVYIGKITHEIEIGFWGKREIMESEDVEREIRNIIKDSKSNDECYEKSYKYFDDLYEKLNAKEKGKELK